MREHGIATDNFVISGMRESTAIHLRPAAMGGLFNGEFANRTHALEGEYPLGFGEQMHTTLCGGVFARKEFLGTL